MELKEIRKSSTEELLKTVSDLKKELLSLRIKLSVGNEVKTHELKKVRHNIAQILTVLNERKGGANVR